MAKILIVNSTSYHPIKTPLPKEMLGGSIDTGQRLGCKGLSPYHRKQQDQWGD